MNPRAGRLSLAGTLVAAGIAVQLATLHWNHPTAFLAFIFIGSPLTFVGILVYLSCSLLPPR